MGDDHIGNLRTQFGKLIVAYNNWLNRRLIGKCHGKFKDFMLNFLWSNPILEEQAENLKSSSRRSC